MVKDVAMAVQEPNEKGIGSFGNDVVYAKDLVPSQSLLDFASGTPN